MWCPGRQVFQRKEKSSMSNVAHGSSLKRLSFKTKINAKSLHKFLNRGLVNKTKHINSRAF